MQYRKLKGTALFDGTSLLENKVLLVSSEGRIVDVVPFDAADEEVEHLDAILCPGFINAHCHLELSHLKGVIPEGTGLVNFLIAVVKGRGGQGEGKEGAIRKAAEELYNNGISGVGDICNTTDALATKLKSSIRWHSFIEVINFYDQNLQKALANYGAVLDAHLTEKTPAVLTPHAPYSVSAETYAAINKATTGKIISIHNAETSAENELFLTGNGDFLRMYNEFGNGSSPFPVTGRSSLQSWLPHFNNGQTIILVHNTFLSEEDILFAKDHAEKYGLQLVYCLCPNANLYIENRLPPVDLLLKHDCSVVVGTDSYSSNHQLSIAAELKTLKQYFPSLSITTLLRWATSNGAAALGWNDLGSFEKGTQPGVVALNETLDCKRII